MKYICNDIPILMNLFITSNDGAMIVWKIKVYIYMKIMNLCSNKETDENEYCYSYCTDSIIMTSMRNCYDA